MGCSTVKPSLNESSVREPLFHLKLESSVTPDDVSSASIRWQSCPPKPRDHKKAAEANPTDIKYTYDATDDASNYISF